MWKKATAFILSSCLLAPCIIYANDEVYIGGDSVGIAITYDGVVISGTYTIDYDGKSYNPSDQGFIKGDMIVAIDDQEIHSLEALYQQLMKYQKPVNEVAVDIMRDGKKQRLTLITLYDRMSQTSKCGLYVKDEISGVGTVTFYDPQSKRYGALGHEIIDPDLEAKARAQQGHIYDAYVDHIVKAQPHNAGEKQATIDYRISLGDVQKNTNIGIYGNYKMLPDFAKAYEWAKQDEIKVGKAIIETVVQGKKIEQFDIEITKLHKQTSSDVKGIEFIVTDPRLLSISNGIVQGMSGSPIIQNNKLIGAITHVVTANPVKGYGVYIEWMIQEAK